MLASWCIKFSLHLRCQHPTWAQVRIPATPFSIKFPALAPGRAAGDGTRAGSLSLPQERSECASRLGHSPWPVQPPGGGEQADGRFQLCLSKIINLQKYLPQSLIPVRSHCFLSAQCACLVSFLGTVPHQAVQFFVVSPTSVMAMPDQAFPHVRGTTGLNQITAICIKQITTTTTTTKNEGRKKKACLSRSGPLAGSWGVNLCSGHLPAKSNAINCS